MFYLSLQYLSEGLLGLLWLWKFSRRIGCMMLNRDMNMAIGGSWVGLHRYGIASKAFFLALVQWNEMSFSNYYHAYLVDSKCMGSI